MQQSDVSENKIKQKKKKHSKGQWEYKAGVKKRRMWHRFLIQDRIFSPMIILIDASERNIMYLYYSQYIWWEKEEGK